MDLINFKNIIDESLISFINKEKNTKIKEVLAHSLIGGKELDLLFVYLFLKIFLEI